MIRIRTFSSEISCALLKNITRFNLSIILSGGIQHHDQISEIEEFSKSRSKYTSRIQFGNHKHLV